MNQKPVIVEYEEIKKYIAHRYPMLLLDRILDIDIMKSALAIKNITGNDPVFQGHYPGMPIYPGVLMVESLGQLCSFLCFYSYKEKNNSSNGNMVILTGLDRFRFRSPVYPGDKLYLSVELNKIARNFWRFSCKGYKYNEENPDVKIPVISGLIIAIDKSNI